MLKTMLRRWIDKFERTWKYDASYMRYVLEQSPGSLFKFSMGTQAMDRTAAPMEAIVAAGVVSSLREDCGPCTQVGIDIAAANGVKPEVLRAILAGDEGAMGETAALAYRFARASLDRDMEAADPLRDEIVRRWGEKALVAIGLTLVASRMYPTLKYALGFGKTCSKVVVAGETAPFTPLAKAA